MTDASPTATEQAAADQLVDEKRRAEWREHRARTRAWSLTPMYEFTDADLQRWRSIWQAAFEAAKLQTVREATSKHIQSIDAQLARLRARSVLARPYSPDADL